MENDSYLACRSSAPSKVAESNQESAYIMDPVQDGQTHLAKVLDLTDTATSKASTDARLDPPKGHKSQNSQPPNGVAVENSWANALVNHCGWRLTIPSFETDMGGTDMDVYRSNTSSSYDSVISDLSSVQSDHAIIVDEPLFGTVLGLGFDVFDNSAFQNARSPSKSDPIHLASVLCEQKPAAPSRTSSRAPRIFKCWVETCSHFNEGFLTLKERRIHYEKVHSHLILTCRVAGCKASPFLREQDRTKHENRMHSEFGLISLRTSKRPSADDVVEVPNGNTLPSKISQEATLPSGSLTILGAQKSYSVCSDGSVGFDTDSTWSGEESDWEDDGIDPNELLAQMIQDSEVAVRPLLTPMKRELVDDIMKEFWIIFNQEWSANIRNCSGTPNSGSSSVSPNKGETGNEPNKDNAGQKRQRHNNEGDEDFDGDGKRDHKRPRIESPPDVSQEKRRFACPYRKHDPRTYCHRIRCWRPCALTPLETIARVKCVSSQSYTYNR